MLEKGKRDTDEANEEYLLMLLNTLPTFIGNARYSVDEDVPQAITPDYKLRRLLATERFPHFGYYNIPSHITEKIGEAEIDVGDAIDDVADIYGDLFDVCWLSERGFEDEALFSFENSYQYYWGMHCRCLQLYIHALAYGI